MKTKASLVLLFIISSLHAQEAERDFRITKKYLNIPIQQSQERQWMTFDIDGKHFTQAWMRLSKDQPDYWVFADVSAFTGKTVTLTYPEPQGLDVIYQSGFSLEL